MSALLRLPRGVPARRDYSIHAASPADSVADPDRTHKPQPPAPFSIIRTPAQTDNTGAVTTTPENPYLRDAVLTATPEQLQLMLYDGCIRYALQARDAIEQKTYDVSYDRLARAQNIISEMRSGLKHEVNPELCERVAAVYGFLHRKLLDANIHRNVSMIDDALRVLRIERETWQILVHKVNRIRDGADDDTSATATHDPSGDQRTVSFLAEG